jgi:hypothetical protein
MSESETVKAIKGFDQNLKCRGFQYEIGANYTHDGEVKACHSGFHAIEGHPLELFSYYPPATSRYCDVTAGGHIERHDSDSKIASAVITIEAEVSLPEIVNRAVKWVFDRAKWSEGPMATGDNEGATASGDQGAATASGSWGAATASGRWGAATASGYQGKARAKEGCAIFLVERNDDYEIINVFAGIAGKDGIKPNVWYRLEEGKPVEVVS